MTGDVSVVFVDLALALGLGVLVGLQREWADTRMAGIRTFPLITVFGALTAHLADPFGGWVVVAGALGVTAVVVTGALALLGQADARGTEPDPGLTTEFAALVMFAVGALLAVGHRAPAVVLGGTVAVLLHWKRPLHDLVERIGPDDVQAMMRFVLVALVILPVLPDRAYGPYEVLNPFEIWLMVVLIVGISLGAYVASRLLGARGGTIAAGALGGMISSTATTVSYARRSAAEEARAPSAALVIMLASTFVFARVFLEIAVVAPSVAPAVAPPLVVMMVYMLVLCSGLFLRERRELAETPPEREAPSELGTAIVFGLLYAVVLVAVAAVEEHLGEGALYGVAAISGLTDVDAITLSTAQMAKAGRLTAERSWRLVLVGTLSNLVFKGLVVVVLARAALIRRIGVLFGLTLAGGGVLLAVWP